MKLPTTIILMHVLCSTLFAQTDSSYILLSSGERIEGTIEMHHPFLGTSYLTLNDSIKYPLGSVRAFQNSEGYFGKVAGTKTNMVRRTAQGKIDLYQELKSSWVFGQTYSFNTPMGVQTNSNPSTFSTYSVDYFSKDGGGIREADYSNLKTVLADNLESMRHLGKYNTLRTVQWSLAGGGVALLIGGLATSSKDGINTGLVVSGGVVAALAWIPYLMKSGELERAVREYNK